MVWLGSKFTTKLRLLNSVLKFIAENLYAIVAIDSFVLSN